MKKIFNDLSAQSLLLLLLVISIHNKVECMLAELQLPAFDGSSLSTDVIVSVRKTKLHFAALRGDVDAASKLLEAELALDVQDRHGFTPLYCAALRGHRHMVSLLSEKGAAVDLPDNQGLSALHRACYKGNLTMIQCLLDCGAMLSLKTPQKNTVIHCAAAKGHLEAVHLLLKCLRVRSHMMSNPLNVRNKYGMSALHWAARGGHTDVARFLLSNGALLDAIDVAGRTPLYMAVQFGHSDTARLLTEAGALVEVEDNKKVTPMHLAAALDSEVLISLLFENGASTEAADSDGNRPLHWAARNSKLKAIRRLKELGALIDVTNNANVTPLQYVIMQNQTIFTLCQELGGRLIDETMNDSLSSDNPSEAMSNAEYQAQQNDFDDFSEPSEQELSEYKCGICQEFVKPADISFLNCKCNTYYHAECIERWHLTDHKVSCPTCRKTDTDIRSLSMLRE